MIGRSSVRKLERKLREMDEAIAAAQADLDRIEAAQRDIDPGELNRIEADVRLGLVNEEQATARRTAILESIAVTFNQTESLRGAIEELRRRGAMIAREIGDARKAEAERAVADAETARAEAERRLEAAERHERNARQQIAEVEAANLMRRRN